MPSEQLQLVDHLDGVMRVYDVVERHSIRIHAPAPVVFKTACEMDFERIPLVRAIFRVRELLLGSKPAQRTLPGGFIAKIEALGWRKLSEIPGREIVMGAVAQPWLADVQFRALERDDFLSFHEPNYVKIAWIFRVDPDADGSIASTETRAVATDSSSRAKFLAYWKRVRPGVRLIRRAILSSLRKQAKHSSKS